MLEDRFVKCFLCKEHIDLRREPEYTITVCGGCSFQKEFIHYQCWDKLKRDFKRLDNTTSTPFIYNPDFEYRMK